MKTIDIYGVVFELSNKPVVNIHRINNRNLHDCYSKPSATKISIYNYWSDYFINKLNTYDFGILGYNSMIFSIEAMFVYEGVRYYAKITPTHNYLYKRIYT